MIHDVLECQLSNDYVTICNLWTFCLLYFTLFTLTAVQKWHSSLFIFLISIVLFSYFAFCILVNAWVWGAHKTLINYCWLKWWWARSNFFLLLKISTTTMSTLCFIVSHPVVSFQTKFSYSPVSNMLIRCWHCSFVCCYTFSVLRLVYEISHS